MAEEKLELARKSLRDDTSSPFGENPTGYHDNPALTLDETPSHDSYPASTHDVKVHAAHKPIHESNKDTTSKAAELEDVQVDTTLKGGQVDTTLKGAEATISASEDEGFGGPPTVRRDRPFSASMVSRRTGASTTSRASLSPSVLTSPYTVNNMFSYREGVFDKAVAECQQSVIQATLDGELKGSWLLTEIDHWDHERERVVLLTDNSLLLIKYNFIKLAPSDIKRIPLNSVEALNIGDLVYPSASLMAKRDHGGLRVTFDQQAPWFVQRWNPWCGSIPYVTFTHHLLIYNRNEVETVTFNVNDLAESLEQAITAVRRREGLEATKHIGLVEEPILIESYASVTSMIFNQSKLGFNLDRGGVSY